MANKRQYGFDESKFKPGQRKAALALVEKEFAKEGEKRTNEEIAADAGVTRMTLYVWDTQDDNFIRYKRYLTDDFMDTQVAFVYSKLINSIDQGSVRAIELFMKRMGDLANKQEISFPDSAGSGESFEDRKDDILRRLKQTSGEKEGEE